MRNAKGRKWIHHTLAGIYSWISGIRWGHIFYLELSSLVSLVISSASQKKMSCILLHFRYYTGCLHGLVHHRSGIWVATFVQITGEQFALRCLGHTHPYVRVDPAKGTMFCASPWSFTDRETMGYLISRAEVGWPMVRPTSVPPF